MEGKIKCVPEDFEVEEIPIKKESKTDEHLIFWIEKVNIDTQDVIKLLSRKLRVSRKRFSYAGTKDKFAVARQRISVWDPDRRIENVLPELTFKRVRKIWGFERGDRLCLGDLAGNKFWITIRDVSLSDEEIREELERFKNFLMPNFFGEQRFGGVRPITHLVGLEMLKRNFEEAVKIYIAYPFESEPEDARRAREYVLENWGNRKAYARAIALFPRRFRWERCMLDYLAKHPRDFVGALRRFPKKVRKLFINAVQSWIFNEVLKELVEKYGVERLRGVKIPLVGYDTMLSEENEIDRMVAEMMSVLGIEQRDFLMPSMPEMKTSGSYRDAVVEIKDFEVVEIGDDELFPGKRKVKVFFSLPPGSYATVLLDYILGKR